MSISAPPSELVARVMFDQMLLSAEELEEICAALPLKTVRWMAIHHPDNGVRKRLFELTNVPVGEGTVLNAGLILYDEYKGLVAFGERVAVATGVTIVAASGPNNSQLAAHPYVRERLIQTEAVTIGDDVWIGANAIILPGVNIGAGSIVSASAVVRSDVPAGVVVAGIPARIVRTLG